MMRAMTGMMRMMMRLLGLLRLLWLLKPFCERAGLLGCRFRLLGLLGHEALGGGKHGGGRYRGISRGAAAVECVDLRHQLVAP